MFIQYNSKAILFRCFSTCVRVVFSIFWLFRWFSVTLFRWFRLLRWFLWFRSGYCRCSGGFVPVFLVLVHALQERLAEAVKAGLHVRRKHKRKYKHKRPKCKPVRRKHKRLVLHVLMLASSRFTRTTQRRNHKKKKGQR